MHNGAQNSRHTVNTLTNNQTKETLQQSFNSCRSQPRIPTRCLYGTLYVYHCQTLNTSYRHFGVTTALPNGGTFHIPNMTQTTRHEKRKVCSTEPGTVVVATNPSHVKDNRESHPGQENKNDLRHLIDLGNIICYCKK